MYNSFSNTFSTDTVGDKKFFFTVNKPKAGAEFIYEGKINDDKTVQKFKMSKDEAGDWKIQPQKMPSWVADLEKAFGERIEASIGSK